MTPLSAGRYQLLEEVGRGAVGVVYKAFDPVIGRTVAVKTMRLPEAESEMSRAELLTRFQTETRAAGLLTHPNIVVIYDAGEKEGLFYITMEYVEGQSLQAALDRRQVFPVPRILKIMEQACAALGYAHQRSVVHRDIKPANIMLAGDDTVKISDFGTAKILQLGTTQTGQIIGTPSYMSPEQVKGKLVDGRSDIFSLGVVLYELATCEKPFPGQNVTTVIYKIVNEEPVPPRRIDSSVHPGLSSVIMRALAKDPAERFQTCQELFEALKGYRNLVAPQEATMVMQRRDLGQTPREPSPPEPPMVPAEPVARTPAAPPPVGKTAAVPREAPAMRWVQPEQPPPKKRSTGTWVLTLLLIAVIGAGGYLEWPKLRMLLEQVRPELITHTTAPTQSSPPATQPAPVTTTQTSTPENPAPGGNASSSAQQPAVTTNAAPAPGAATPNEKPAAPAPAEPPDIESQVEQILAQAGMGKRVHARVTGNKLTLTGTLTRRERTQLLKQLRTAELGLRLVDKTQLASAAPSENASESPSERPRPAPGKGEIEVLSNQIGGLAVLHGPNGETVDQRSMPCRFEGLAPGRYTMELTMEGYRPEKRIVELTAGNIHQVKVQFQAYVSGIQVTSEPAGATVLVNGQVQGSQTPTTLNLPPGRYTVAIRKPGYQEDQRTMDLAPDSFLHFSVVLAAQVRGVGWVEVRTVPPGADILVDGKSSGQRSPARLMLSSGPHSLTMYLKGFRPGSRSVTVEDNKTQTVDEVLQQP